MRSVNKVMAATADTKLTEEATSVNHLPSSVPVS